MTRVNKSAWTDDEIVHIVAYLDHYTKKRRDNGRWSDEEILNRIASHIASRSLTQIRGKIFALSGCSNTAFARKRFQNVFKTGSRCLRLLPDDLKPKIREIVEVIEFNEESETISTPQLLRNGKERSASIEPRWRRSHRSRSRAETPAKKSLNELRKVALRQRNTTTGRLKSETDEDLSYLANGSLEHADLVSGVQSRESNQRVEVANSVDGNSLDDVQISRVSASDEEMEFTRPRLFNLDDLQRVPALDYERDASMNLPASSSDECLKVLRDLLEDNKHFRDKYVRVKKEKDELMFRERASPNLQRRIEKNSSFSQSSVILKYEQDIADLERSVRLQNVVIPFLQVPGPASQHSNFKEVRDAFDRLMSTIHCLATTEDFRYDVTRLHRSPSPVSKFLLQRSLPQECLSKSAGSNCSQAADNEAMAKLAASLTAAAVCEWIFLSDSRCAILLTTPVLECYRELLQTACGVRVVRNLDILAHQSIVRDESFREVYLMRTAENCMAKLLEVFCELNNKNIILKDNAEAKSQIKNVFLHALTLKYELLLREEKFRIIWPGPGSVFDDDTMSIYKADKGKGAQLHGKTGALAGTLTLVPGLQGYAYDKKRIHDLVFFESEDYDTTNLTWTLRGTVSLV